MPKFETLILPSAEKNGILLTRPTGGTVSSTSTLAKALIPILKFTLLQLHILVILLGILKENWKYPGSATTLRI